MKKLILAALLVATVAVAATVNINDTYVFQALFRPWTRTTTQLPTASAYTGYMAYNTSNGDLTVSDGINWRTASPILASASWDFPQLDVSSVFGLPCNETAAVTATGALLSHACAASTNLGMDGGAALIDLADLTCRVSAANAVKFKLCLRASTDGGTTYNLGDAGFYARVSN